MMDYTMRRLRGREERRYSYFKNLPTVFKICAFVSLAFAAVTVLLLVVFGSISVLLEVAFLLAYAILSFVLFMGLSEWARVAMETHLNSMHVARYLVKQDVFEQPPETPAQAEQE